jgi:S1-C subfamily serine protease
MMSKWSRLVKQGLLVALALALSVTGAAVVAAQPGRPNPNPVRPPMAQLAQSGFLGIGIEDGDMGALITEVLADSAAERAGLLVGDVITAVNGEAVVDAEALRDAIGGLRPRESVTLEVLRDGETVTIEARLDRRTISPRGFDFGFGGVPFENMPFQFRMDMDGTSLSFSADGWKIEALPEGSPLLDAGLQVGDLITAVDGESLAPGDLLAYLATLEADSVELMINRDEESLTLTVPVEALQSVFTPMGMNFRFEGMPFEFGVPGMGRGGMDFDFGRVPFQGMPFAYGNGRLGVTFVTLDEAVAAERGIEQTEGALVVDVLADTPAALAGLQTGDVITAVNGEPVDAERTLRDRLIAYESGDTVALTLVRGGETLTLEATLDEPVMMDAASMFRGMIPGMRFNAPRQPEVEPNL